MRIVRRHRGAAQGIGLLLLTLLAAVPVFCQNAYYLPQIVDGSIGNRSWATSIVVANVGSTAAKATLSWTNANGSPWPVSLVDLGRSSTAAAVLPPGTIRRFSTDGTGDGSAGAATVTSDSFLQVSAVVTVRNESGALIGESVVDAPEILSSFRLPLDSTSGVSTGIAVMNPGSTATVVRAKVLDGSGLAVQNTVFRLPPGGRLHAWTGLDLFPGLAELRGTIQIDSDTPVAAFGMMRRSSGGTLFPVADPSSRRLRFVFPQIGDGNSAAGTRVSSLFLVSNLSDKPADIRVSIVRDDGMPLELSPAGAGHINAGASAIWETGGLSGYSAGSAVIQSTQPIAVAALLTVFDLQGSVMGESALAESRPSGRSLLPFDSSDDIVACNGTSQPVTVMLTLVDSDGVAAGTTQLGTVSAHGRLKAKAADLFSDAAGIGSAVFVSTGGALEGGVSVASIRTMQSPGSFSTAGASVMPVTGTGLVLRPSLDAAHTANASIGAAGGTLSLTNAEGTKFTLTIPPASLFATESITMTAVTKVDGLPDLSFSAGVQLEPDGLALINPATLEIESAAPLLAGDVLRPVPADLVPLGWHGAGQGAYLNVVLPDPDRLVVLLSHFSGAGIGSGDVTSLLATVADMLDLQGSIVASRLRNATRGGATEAHVALFYDAARDMYHNGVEQFMLLALSSNDLNVLRCALQHVLGYSRQMSLVGAFPNAATPDSELSEGQQELRSIQSAINQFTADAMRQSTQLAKSRCDERRDPAAFAQVLAIARQNALLGLPDNGGSSGFESCYPRLQLEVTTTIAAAVPGLYDYTGTVTAMVKLSGHFDKDELTSVSDPSKDLFTSYLLSGQEAEEYTSSYSGLPCPVSSVVRNPGTYSVIEKHSEDRQSRIRYKFFSKFQPQAVTSHGMQLCSYCPVFDVATERVEMLVDPGRPRPNDEVTIHCMLPFTDLKSTYSAWSLGWNALQVEASLSGDLDLAYLVTGWVVVPSGQTLATKELSRIAPFKSSTATERSTFRLTGLP